MPGIIVGVDGSGHSQRALEWAMKEAAIRHAPLTVLAVHEAGSLAAFVLLYGVLATIDLLLMLRYSRQQLPPARAEADVDAPVPAIQY